MRTRHDLPAIRTGDGIIHFFGIGRCYLKGALVFVVIVPRFLPFLDVLADDGGTEGGKWHYATASSACEVCFDEDILEGVSYCVYSAGELEGALGLFGKVELGDDFVWGRQNVQGMILGDDLQRSKTIGG